MRVRHIVICGMPVSTVFFCIIPKTVWFSKEKISYWTYNEFVLLTVLTVSISL
jgi:hypothetical protein